MPYSKQHRPGYSNKVEITLKIEVKMTDKMLARLNDDSERLKLLQSNVFYNNPIEIIEVEHRKIETDYLSI